jgi:hypothetical protein
MMFPIRQQTTKVGPGMMQNIAHIRFEVVVFNEDVQDMLKHGKHHPHLDDRWALKQTHHLFAYDETDARSKAIRRYPRAKGFVIERLSRS